MNSVQNAFKISNDRPPRSSFICPYNSYEMLDHHHNFQWRDSGILVKIVYNHLKTYNSQFQLNKASEELLHPLRVNHVLWAFYWLFVGVSLSTFAFILELLMRMKGFFEERKGKMDKKILQL